MKSLIPFQKFETTEIGEDVELDFSLSDPPCGGSISEIWISQLESGKSFHRIRDQSSAALNFDIHCN